jgi:dTDP-4-amino-4,6-dideoxygalactose transaminase
MDWKVPLADLDYGWQEEEAVLRVIRSKWLTMGGITQEFEEHFALGCGAQYAFGVSNATAGLHLACLALGIGPGDEVIVPSLTFVATSNAVLYTGATVKFADILGPENLTIDPAEIDRLATAHTKAVIPMHYGGYACQMPEILAAAARHHLAVIEDASHAPGAVLGNLPLGTWGDVGVFSFFSNKNLSTGEGGMVVTNRQDLAEHIRLQRSHGMTSLTYDRHKGHAHSYDVVALGYNYRIDEIHSALGLAQLTKLPDNNRRRAGLTASYRRLLDGSELEVPFKDHPGLSAYHLMPLLLPAWVDRTQVMNEMKAAGIQTSIHYPPIHTFSFYRERIGQISLPKTEAVAAREITLPLYPTMGEEKVDLVAKTILVVLDGLRQPNL